VDENKIKRINELAKKSKTTGLSPEEKEEQNNLRQEYIKSFRSNLESTLKSVVVVDKDGNKSRLKKKEEKGSN